MEKDETDSSLRPLLNGFFLVHTGNLVRIRLLSLHGLALQSADEIGTLWYARVLPKISHSIIDGCGRRPEAGRYFCRFRPRPSVRRVGPSEHKRLEEKPKSLKNVLRLFLPLFFFPNGIKIAEFSGLFKNARFPPLRLAWDVDRHIFFIHSIPKMKIEYRSEYNKGT